MILPNRLQIGDTIGVIAPASPPNLEHLQLAVPFFEQMGLHVRLGKHLSAVHGYLAGTDAERLADFHEMIADPIVKAIIFARGGYGTGRIATSIDYQLIMQHPKIIWGYSDITYLHIAIGQATGLVTFHGPMVASDVGSKEFDALSASMFQQLFEPTELCYSEAISPLQVLVHGEVDAQIIGGNLSLLVSTLGTPFEVDTRGKILLIEDIGEAPYRIDSMLNQLTYAGKLTDAAGIIVGDFTDSDQKNKPTLTLEEVFDHYFSHLNCPVMTGFKIGHCFPNIAIPLGVMARMNTLHKTVTICPGVQGGSGFC